MSNELVGRLNSVYHDTDIIAVVISVMRDIFQRTNARRTEWASVREDNNGVGFDHYRTSVRATDVSHLQEVFAVFGRPSMRNASVTSFDISRIDRWRRHLSGLGSERLSLHLLSDFGQTDDRRRSRYSLLVGRPRRAERSDLQWTNPPG